MDVEELWYCVMYRLTEEQTITSSHNSCILSIFYQNPTKLKLPQIFNSQLPPYFWDVLERFHTVTITSYCHFMTVYKPSILIFQLQHFSIIFSLLLVLLPGTTQRTQVRGSTDNTAKHPIKSNMLWVGLVVTVFCRFAMFWKRTRIHRVMSEWGSLKRLAKAFSWLTDRFHCTLKLCAPTVEF